MEKSHLRPVFCVATLITLMISVSAFAAEKPNILVIWGDDIGVHNVSAYNHGVMGYQTPNIDRIAEEGAMFTYYYAQQSCTAGRAVSSSVSSRSGQVFSPSGYRAVIMVFPTGPPPSVTC